MGWFVLQIIGRGVEKLPLTELEILSLALAVLISSPTRPH